MKRVISVRAPMSKRRQVLDRILNRSSCPGDRLAKLDLSDPRREQDGAIAALRKTVIRAIDDFHANTIVETLKRAFEIVEDRMPCNGWHVFHGDDFRKQILYEPREVVEQAPATILLYPFSLLITARIR